MGVIDEHISQAQSSSFNDQESIRIPSIEDQTGLLEVNDSNISLSSGGHESPSFLTQGILSGRNSSSSSSAFQQSTIHSFSFPSQLPRNTRLDNRYSTRVSQLLQYHTNLDPQKDLEISASCSLSNIEPYENSDSSIFKWLKLKKLCNYLYSEEAKLLYGDPVSVSASALMCIGTSKGYTLIFDYHQNINITLGKDSESMECGKVSVVALSADSTYAASGHERGDIFVWDLSKPLKPILHISPISETDRFKKKMEGHIINVPINYLNFVGNRHTALISSDISGLVFLHNGYRNVLGYHATTRKILGKSDTPIEANTTTIFGCSILPLGSSVELSDTMGIIAVMTPNILAIVSTSPALVTLFKTGKPKLAQEELGISGCLAWFPSVTSKDTNTKTLSKLAYCWCNILTIIEMEIIETHDPHKPNFQFKKTKRWIGQESFVSINWLNSKVLVLLSATEQMIVINESTMSMVSYIDVMSKHIYHRPLYPKNVFDTNAKISQFYANSVKVYKGKLFMLGKYECFIGNLINWADKLMNLINRGDYVDALEQARQYYSGEADLILSNLPQNDISRHSLVLNYLIDILKASLTHTFKDSYESTIHKKTQLLRTLTVCLKVCVAIKDDTPLVSLVYETFVENEEQGLFFEMLEPLIFRGEIICLPPDVLKDMVEYYILEKRGLILEELICLLDIRTIDIDLTTQLCKKHHLRDTLIYVWNVMIHDYISPLADFIKDISLLSKGSASGLSPNEIERLTTECSTVYSYISYILTGRQYPTEKSIAPEEETPAKLNIYYFLFKGTSLSWPPESPRLYISDNHDHEPAFPYLYLLLKFDCLGFLSALNEAFEDRLLNDDDGIANNTKPYETRLSRQHIVDVLLDLFELNDDFSNRDRCELSIFIGRNYPKYSQFIRLSESTLNQIIKNLCSYSDEEIKVDCELALQSLLSIYHSPNVSELLSSFQAAGFYDILYNIHKSEGRYSKVLEIWLDRAQHVSENGRHSLSIMLDMCLRETRDNRTERASVEKYISTNYEILCSLDCDSFVSIIHNYCPNLHKNVLGFKNLFFQYNYLKNLFDLVKKNENSLSLIDQKFILIYIERLCDFDKASVFDFVKFYNVALEPDQTTGICKKLKSSGSIDSLVLLLGSLDKYEEALDETSSHLSELESYLIELLENDEDPEGQLEPIINEIWKYLKIAINLCENDKTKADIYPGTDLYINEQMWLKLLIHNVDFLKEISNYLPDSPNRKQIYIFELSKRLIQESFSNLIDFRAKDQFSMDNNLSFLSIFTHFLNNSSSGVTDLDVRSILEELFLAYRHETEMLQVILKILNDNIFKEMELLYSKKLHGWTIRKDCASCGKRIWGKGISQENYSAWEDKRKANILNVRKTDSLFGKQYDENSYKKCELVMFDCHHGYHKTCLTNFGVKELKCVLCAEL